MKWAWIALCGLFISASWAAEPARDLRVVPKANGQGVGGRYAVLVAVGDYEDATISDLPYSVADAEELARVLTDPAIGGFAERDVVLLTDKAPEANGKPTRKNILATLCLGTLITDAPPHSDGSKASEDPVAPLRALSSPRRQTRRVRPPERANSGAGELAHFGIEAINVAGSPL